MNLSTFCNSNFRNAIVAIVVSLLSSQIARAFYFVISLISSDTQLRAARGNPFFIRSKKFRGECPWWKKLRFSGGDILNNIQVLAKEWTQVSLEIELKPWAGCVNALSPTASTYVRYKNGRGEKVAQRNRQARALHVIKRIHISFRADKSSLICNEVFIRFVRWKIPCASVLGNVHFFFPLVLVNVKRGVCN